MGGEKSPDDSVHGTTLRVYRFIYRQGHPVSIHEVQGGLGMASPSTAHYHVQKLIASGMVREEGGGYVVDKVFLDNFVRIRRTAVPFQAALAAFFGTCLIVLLFVVRPDPLTSGYVLGVVVTGVGLLSSAILGIRDVRQSI